MILRFAGLRISGSLILSMDCTSLRTPFIYIDEAETKNITAFVIFI